MKKLAVLLLIFFGCFYLSFLLLDALFPLDLHLLSRPIGKIYTDRKGEVLREELALDQRYRYAVKMTHIQKLQVQALLSYEDRFFYSHPGINPFSLLRALVHNLTHPNKIGGSTLTMQVARMLEKRSRTVKSKIIEMFRAMQFEWMLTKDQILETYFLIAPYGGNIEGIRAASRLYADKEPTELSFDEILYFTILPRNPNAFQPDNEGQVLPEVLLKMQALKNKLCKSMENTNCDSKLPSLNLKRRVHQELASHATRRADFSNHSSLDTGLQKKLEEFLRKVSWENPTPHRDGAALVVEIDSGKVRAYAGSPDFLRQSQIDAVLVRRSPGSLLKPFIYALSLDEGLIRPRSKILDVPYYFSQYVPKNLDSKSRGLLRSEDALNLSLNPPAVLLQSHLTGGGLFTLFNKLGWHHPGEDQHLGLSIALGGREISLWEMSGLYTSLLSGGGFRELSLQEGQPLPPASVKIFSPEAAHLTLSMLWNNLPATRAYPNIKGWIYKTGTSSYHRDLWMMAANSTYLVGIWLGSLNNSKGESHFAQQVLYEPVRTLLASLEGEPLDLNTSEFPGIKSVWSCQDHVLFDEEKCTLKVPDWKIRGVHEDPCQILQAESLNYLRKHLPKTDWERVLNRCDSHFKNLPPKIIWPTEGSVIVENPFQKSTILGQCFSHQSDQQVHIFLDQQHYGIFNSGETLELKTLPGEHSLLCSDSQALGHQIQFQIQGDET